jgi:hypothetical protein
MAKIQCPHCQAINEDRDLDQPCRKCGTVIGAPISSLDSGSGAPSSATSTANINTPATTPTQKQFQRDRQSQPDPMAERAGGEKRYE